MLRLLSFLVLVITAQAVGTAAEAEDPTADACNCFLNGLVIFVSFSIGGFTYIAFKVLISRCSLHLQEKVKEWGPYLMITAAVLYFICDYLGLVKEEVDPCPCEKEDLLATVFGLLLVVGLVVGGAEPLLVKCCALPPVGEENNQAPTESQPLATNPTNYTA